MHDQSTANHPKPDDRDAAIQMTKDEWRKTHKDFKTVIDGQRYVMRMTRHGTCLVPVSLI